MTSFVVSVTKGMPMDLDPEDYEVLADNEPKSDNKGITISLAARDKLGWTARTDLGTRARVHLRRVHRNPESARPNKSPMRATLHRMRESNALFPRDRPSFDTPNIRRARRARDANLRSNL